MILSQVMKHSKPTQTRDVIG